MAAGAATESVGGQRVAAAGIADGAVLVPLVVAERLLHGRGIPTLLRWARRALAPMDSTTGVVAITDRGWYDYLRAQTGL